MISNDELWSFIKFGKSGEYKFMLVLFDIEDKDYYPIFFNSKEEMESYENKIISETKCRVEGEYNL